MGAKEGSRFGCRWLYGAGWYSRGRRCDWQGQSFVQSLAELDLQLVVSQRLVVDPCGLAGCSRSLDLDPVVSQGCWCYKQAFNSREATGSSHCNFQACGHQPGPVKFHPHGLACFGKSQTLFGAARGLACDQEIFIPSEFWFCPH